MPKCLTLLYLEVDLEYKKDKIQKHGRYSPFSSGKSYAVYCTKAYNEEENGFRSLCSSCRAVRELPEEYFPRIINEVICKDGDCLAGDFL